MHRAGAAGGSRNHFGPLAVKAVDQFRINRTANLQEFAFFAADNSADVRVKLAFQRFIDAWNSVFGAEDDVIGEAGVGAHSAVVSCDSEVPDFRRPVGSSFH